MKKTKKKTLGFLLIIGSGFIGNGIGQILHLTTGKLLTTATTMIGIGIGFIAAFLYHRN